MRRENRVFTHIIFFQIDSDHHSSREGILRSFIRNTTIDFLSLFVDKICTNTTILSLSSRSPFSTNIFSSIKNRNKSIRETRLFLYEISNASTRCSCFCFSIFRTAIRKTSYRAYARKIRERRRDQ